LCDGGETRDHISAAEAATVPAQNRDSATRGSAQLPHLRPDLQIPNVRGNVDTRLPQLHEGPYDARILAAAGLHRLGRQDAITAYLDPAVMPQPAAAHSGGRLARRSPTRHLDVA
jgi:porphobilinogen deaminase